MDLVRGLPTALAFLIAPAVFALGCSSRGSDRDAATGVPGHDAPTAVLPPAPTYYYTDHGREEITPSTTFLVVGFRGELPRIDGWVPLPQTLESSDQARCSLGRSDSLEAIRCMAAGDLFRQNHILVLGRTDVSSEPIEQVGAILLASGAEHACPVYGDPNTAPLVVTDQISVGTLNSDRDALADLAEARHDVVVGEVSPQSFLVKTPGGWCGALFEANAFADTGKFRFAQPNFVRPVTSAH